MESRLAGMISVILHFDFYILIFLGLCVIGQYNFLEILSGLHMLVNDSLENFLVANLLANRRNYRIPMFLSNSIDIVL